VLRGATVHVNAAEMVTKKFSDLKVTSGQNIFCFRRQVPDTNPPQLRRLISTSSPEQMRQSIDIATVGAVSREPVQPS